MKKKIAVFTALLSIFNVCSAQSATQSQGPNNGLIGILSMIIMFAVIVGIPFLWSRSTNKKFKEKFPQYQGKYLWSLLFFPCFYIVMTTFLSFWTIMQINRYEYSRLYLILVICIAMVIASFVIRKKINFFLFNWNQDSANLINKLVIAYVCFLPIYYILFPIVMESYVYFMDYDETSNTFSIIFYILLGVAIWYFSHKKLSNFSLNLPYKNAVLKTKSTSTNHPTENKSSISDKLIELKKLLDQGVIKNEEFAKLKNDILSKN